MSGKRPMLDWQQHDGRNWSARLGTDQYHVAWDEARRNDWSALHAAQGKPFANIDGGELGQLVEDLKRWIITNGGEIPKAPAA
jgi:hypothetical protein